MRRLVANLLTNAVRHNVADGRVEVRTGVKEGKDGHGLGLSIVRAIATAHDATITAHPVPDGGLCVSVIYPPPASPAASPDNHSQGDGHSLKIELATP